MIHHMATAADPSIGVALESVRVLAPVLYQNRKRISDYANRQWRRITGGVISGKVSIYLSMFTRFKVGYTLEDVSENICSILTPYRTSKQDDKAKYGNTEFDVMVEYDYSDSVYATDELLDYDPTSTEEEIVIPAVVGVSFFIFPHGNDTRTQLMDGHCFIETLESKLLEYHIVQKGSFLYILTETANDKLKILQQIAKRAKEWKGQVKSLSSKQTEIKLKLDKLMAKTIGEML